MPSADFDLAVDTAVKARVINNGQSCIAAKRFIVAENIADKFESGFVAKMKALKVGDPMDAATELGPLATYRCSNVAAGGCRCHGQSGCAGTDGRQAAGGTGQLLCADRADRHSERVAGIWGRAVWSGSVRVPRQGYDRSDSSGQRQPLLAPAPAHGRTATPPSATGSPMRSRPAWSPSTRWWMSDSAYAVRRRKMVRSWP